MRALGERAYRSASYEELRAVAADWLAATVGPQAHLSEVDAPLWPALDEARRFLGRRPFRELHELVQPRNKLESALLELFQLTRIRRQVLAYLSVQEGLELDRAGSDRLHAAVLMDEVLRSAGKRRWIGVRWGPWGLRTWLRLDPMFELRSIYAAALRGRRLARSNSPHTRLAVRILVLRFRLEVASIRFVLRRIASGFSGAVDEAAVRAALRTRRFRRNFAFGLLMAVPMAHELKTEEWERLWTRIEEYFPARLVALSRALDEERLLGHGLVKLLKIAFGVVSWRAERVAATGENALEAIFETLRIAFAWGTTQPLVDDVLDDSRSTKAEREDLVRRMLAVFAGKSRTTRSVEAGRGSRGDLAIECLEEVMELTPRHRRVRVGQLFSFLAQAHGRDAGRRLGAPGRALGEERVQELWEDSVLKAALIRVATLEVCGVEVDGPLWSRQLLASLLNQLGDDLWDVAEDLKQGRLTPFTAYLTDATSLDPTRRYLEYCRLVAQHGDPTQPARRRPRELAVALAAHDSVRCMVEASSRRSRGRGPDTTALAHVNALNLASMAATADRAPHIDPDAVLFDLEAAILEAVGAFG